MFEKQFKSSVPTVLAKILFETKNKNKNSELVKLIKVGWSKLEYEVKNTTKEEIEIEKPDKILKIVK